MNTLVPMVEARKGVLAIGIHSAEFSELSLLMAANFRSPNGTFSTERLSGKTSESPKWGLQVA